MEMQAVSLHGKSRVRGTTRTHSSTNIGPFVLGSVSFTLLYSFTNGNVHKNTTFNVNNTSPEHTASKIASKLTVACYYSSFFLWQHLIDFSHLQM